MSQEAFVVDGPLGRVELTASALASLVARSAEAVELVHVRRSRRRPSISVRPDEVYIELGVEAPAGALLIPVGESVQRSVASAVTGSTGLPTRVDVTFEAVS
jgi:uncharacterized alkaline shock family protein YloU